MPPHLREKQIHLRLEADLIHFFVFYPFLSLGSESESEMGSQTLCHHRFGCVTSVIKR